MDSADLKRLKIKRGVMRTATTKLNQKIDGELDKEEPCFAKLEELLDQLKDKEKIIIEHDKNVEAVTEEEDLEDEITIAMEYMDAISVGRTRVKRALRMEEVESQSGQSEHGSGAGPYRRDTVKLSV